MCRQRHTFRKEERLCSLKVIEALFAGGNTSYSAFPLRVVVMELPEGAVVASGIRSQVLISVSKRRFKHAVDRNRVKRQIREAYRQNKHILTQVLEEKGHRVAVAFLWLSNEIFPTDVVEKKMVSLLQRIAEGI